MGRSKNSLPGIDYLELRGEFAVTHKKIIGGCNDK
jgi:hypothetical protein